MSLVEEGVLELSTTARSVLGTDLPLIDDAVTVEQLLAHRSGIGDYLDEEDEDLDLADYLLARPVHELVETDDFLPLLVGHPMKFAPGERFSYCNGGYIVLALIAERVAGAAFMDLVDARVVSPAGMVDTAFSRSDELGTRTAVGYLHADGLRTNVFHLPVRGNGDGGIYTTVADMATFWKALFGGRIVSKEAVAQMLLPRSEVPEDSVRYGMGFWLAGEGDGVMLEGMDTGVSFRSVTDPSRELTYTVISNTTDGAWPVARYLKEYAAQTT
jgi:CubicO group peptidase (beta-lactamase class C family)